MPMDDHDAILAAFIAMGDEHGEHLSACGRSAWTNIHGPSFPAVAGETQCKSHCLCIQKPNGAVTFVKELGENLGAEERPDVPIAEHPLGYTHRALGHRHGLTAQAIRERWGSYNKFAQEVRETCMRLGLW
jgi:hypothetical protein